MCPFLPLTAPERHHVGRTYSFPRPHNWIGEWLDRKGTGERLLAFIPHEILDKNDFVGHYR